MVAAGCWWWFWCGCGCLGRGKSRHKKWSECGRQGRSKPQKLKNPDAPLMEIKMGMARARVEIFPDGLDERDNKLPGVRRRMMHLWVVIMDGSNSSAFQVVL